MHPFRELDFAYKLESQYFSDEIICAMISGRPDVLSDSAAECFRDIQKEFLSKEGYFIKNLQQLILEFPRYRNHIVSQQ